MTDNRPLQFTITEAGSRPVKTADALHRETKKIFPGNRRKVNFTGLIRKLKK
ncbi:MAG TPA: hypothetical protein VFC44_00340 [Candidatus Saccharimonadales bacterium]|nr:hypothetical protein [Candidatus Saccharimonadales bacterium]